MASIAGKLSHNVAIVFDGWTVGAIHYIGISASYTTVIGGEETTMHTLLSMRPLLVGEVAGMTARDHLVHLSQVMRLYGKTEDNVMCLIGDNCSVNRSLANLMKVPLVGCGAHKFNLAIRKWISNQPQVRITWFLVCLLSFLN